MRADQLLVDRGLAASRSQAQRLIASGVQWRVAALGWQRVAKNGDLLPPACELQLLDNAEARYVSRGGLKLEGALRDSGLQVSGLRCLDVGQSTGGFTDCLLQQGAAQAAAAQRASIVRAQAASCGNAGGVMGDLSSRRGLVQGMDDMPGGGKVIKAEVPLSEMFGYSTTLRSMSQGRATYTMEFKHYSEAPKNVADAIITARGK